MHRVIKIILLFVFFIWNQPLHAQFFLNGRAIALNDTCYQLTPAENNAAGSVWNGEKINLNQSFEAVLQIFFGCKDSDGADGIVFGFQPLSTSIGTTGGGMGFANIIPSLGIEMDTHFNSSFGDPTYDHIALTRNGNVNHNSGNTLAGPVQASSVSANIEDCRYHDLRVSWNAGTRTLQVYFDCVLRLTYTANIVQEVFLGDPWVFWGFTSGTGALNNIHEVCFTYTSFLDQFEDVTICPGGTFPLQARGGVSYHWSPAEGLSDPTIPNPVASPEQTTTYTVEILDACNRPFFDDITIAVSGDSLRVELGPDDFICEGTQKLLDAGDTGDRFRWSTGDTISEILAAQPGIYAVTVSWNNPYCISVDEIVLEPKPQPELDIGQDTTLCYGQEILLRAAFPESSYLWQDGSTHDSLRVSGAGWYQVVLTHPCNTIQDLIRIDYEDCRQVFFPNAFTPNRDGINDNFGPMHGGDVKEVLSFQVFDRWGELVYQGHGQTEIPSWNGKFRDTLMPAGVYVYSARIVFRDGHQEDFTGSVELIR